MKIFSSLFLCALCFSFSACQKDGVTPTKTDHIAASPWVYDGGGIDSDKNGTIDFVFPPGALESCRTDNTLTFERNGTGVTNEGATKCNTSDPQQANFNWSFADRESSLNISGNVYPLLNGKFKILTLTASNFSLSKDTVFSSQNVAVIVNLKH